MFLISLIWLIISDFCYIAKYWNSDSIELLVRDGRPKFFNNTQKEFSGALIKYNSRV